jgi:hypothetical protein
VEVRADPRHFPTAEIQLKVIPGLRKSALSCTGIPGSDEADARLIDTRVSTGASHGPVDLDRGITKVEAPIQRSDPFMHSMKPPKVDNVITQK